MTQEEHRSRMLLAMSAKERVQRVYPEAFAVTAPDGHTTIYAKRDGAIIGQTSYQRSAWCNAARRLPKIRPL